jgi:iron complex transport system permease protein
LFRNPLADPFVIGASGGAALGATIAIVAGWQEQLLGLAAVSVSALAGSLLAVTIVCGIASTSARISTSSLLLAGVAVSSMFGALVSLLMFLQDEKLLTIFSWLMGSLSGRSWPAFAVAAPAITAGMTGLWLLSRGLDALTFGEEVAASLGLSPGRLAALVVLCSTAVTAAGVAAGGIIGFVGLIAPHAARFLVGAEHARLIPASALLGAFLLLIADDVARVIAAPAELPVGVITALLGSPFFLVLLRNRQREPGGSDDSA